MRHENITFLKQPSSEFISGDRSKSRSDCLLAVMPVPRRFPPPWSIEEHTESFIVRDATRQALGYFYFDDEPQRVFSIV